MCEVLTESFALIVGDVVASSVAFLLGDVVVGILFRLGFRVKSLVCWFGSAAAACCVVTL